MKNALEEVTAKKAKKKSQRCAKDALVRRHALGQREGGEGHTSYDSLPKGACRMMQDYAKSSARRGDLLRRAADLSAARIPPGLAVVVSVYVCLMAPSCHSLVASFTEPG